jgi:hypothetical protein
MGAVKKTRTRKQTKTVVIFSLIAFVVAALGVQCGRIAWSSGNVLAGGAAVLLVATAAFLALGTGLKSGPCPRCGTLNVELRAGAYRDCPGCGEYLTGDGRDLWLAEGSTVADKPSFGALLPERLVWPEGCAVCRAPSTRIVPISITVAQTGKNLAVSAAALAVGRVVVQTGGERVYSVDVPHCGEHNDGAVLENPTIGGLRILFRSHSYSTAFRQRNNAPVR